jgi:3-dehydroquinate synthase
VNTPPTRVHIEGHPPYDVVIGPGVRAELPTLLGTGVRKVAVITSAGARGIARQVVDELAAGGPQPHLLEVPDGEAAKTIDVASRCWADLGRLGLTRSDAVVGVGGGATTDLAGFVASTWLRGVALALVPTTLLAMVDAAVGGKTAVNTAAGKNLVGSFHQPAGVLCDLSVLASLPSAELVSGLAEVVKCGFVADPAILELVERHPAEAVRPPGPVVRELVERAVRVKARVVSADPREASAAPRQLGREVLNYGHTLGHAIERVEDYRIRHGYAVSIGMVYAAELARLAGRLDVDTARRHRFVLDLVGLPTHYAPGRWEPLRNAMSRDKKARGNQLRFVVLDGVARPAILSGPDPQLLARAYAELSGAA